MGCDIHTYAERKTETGYECIAGLVAFDWRSYGMYGFLANVRNYSDVPPIAEPRGWPDDANSGANDDFESWSGDAHSASWLFVEELTAFDYDQPVEDRRVTVQTAPNSWNGGATAEAGGGQMTTYREFLGLGFFNDLEKLKVAGATRVVFFFDN